MNGAFNQFMMQKSPNNREIKTNQHIPDINMNDADGNGQINYGMNFIKKPISSNNSALNPKQNNAFSVFENQNNHQLMSLLDQTKQFVKMFDDKNSK